MEQVTVDELTWAIIYTEWLPSSKYELVEAPEILYTQNNESNHDVYSEIWIVVKKIK